MTVRRRVVIREEHGQSELPEWAREGALLQQHLVDAGRWAEVSEWLHVYRHVGYAAIDVAGFLLHYFASGQQWSLKEFGVRTAPLRAQLAALGQRREFPTPSSVSRLLGVVAEHDVRPVGPRLLLETTDAAALLQHPAASVRDTFGERWHMFDVDATVQAFRERELPRGPDLPEPRRRCDHELARRGYAGRKRGELRCSRGTLQHAGTGLWVGVVLSPERADGAASLPPLLDALELACRVGSVPRERAILRTDGAGGNVPWLTVCQQRGIHYLTRWGHYGLLGQADVQQLLQRGRWYRVPSSGSGPQREALELGAVELHAGPQTRDADGARFQPVRSRMVISRFRADATSSVGHLVDGWLYELFATDVPADAWPAPETVAQYFGRAAEENRFAQEDRELGLDHLFSYHLPGQELACLLGLMVWNLRLTRGFAQHTPPTELPAPVPRLPIEATPVASAVALTDGAPAASMSDDMVPAVATLANASPMVTVPGDAAPTVGPEKEVTDGVPAATALTVVVPAAVGASATSRASACELPVDDVRALLDELAWDTVLTRLGPKWTRALTGDGLICPEGSVLSASTVIASRHPDGLPSLRLLASPMACRRCSQRSDCAKTDSPQFAKTVSVLLTAEQGQRLGLLLSARPRSKSRGQPKSPLPLSAPQPTPQSASPRHRLPILVRSPDDKLTPGPYAPSEARLVPSEFRHAFRRTCRDVGIAVVVPPLPEARRSRHLGLALTAAERQRRRRSWQARILDNELPAATEVSVLITGPSRALAALGMTASEPARCHGVQANI